MCYSPRDRELEEARKLRAGEACRQRQEEADEARGSTGEKEEKPLTEEVGEVVVGVR